jgi:hypothetical protein
MIIITYLVNTVNIVYKNQVSVRVMIVTRKKVGGVTTMT